MSNYEAVISEQALRQLVKEWQLARDRFELPEATPVEHTQREAWLHQWERQLRDARV